MLDSIVLPLFEFNKLIGLAIVAFIINLFSTVVYKYTTDQLFLKRLKREMKELQEKSKQFRDNQEKLMEINQQIMSKSFEQMKMTFKSSMYTMLPLLLVFVYLSSHFALTPIVPNEPFEVNIYSNNETIDYQIPENLNLLDESKQMQDDEHITTLKLNTSLSGLYILDIEDTKHRVLVTNEMKYENPVQELDGKISKVETVQNKLPFINLFGWQIGYLGSYIIFSIIFSLIIRKILNVH